MSSTLFVTCIYLDLQQRVGNGSLTAMSKRYMESVQHLAERGNKVVVYTDAYSLARIREESRIAGLDTIEIVEKELSDMPYHADSVSIIESNADRYKCSSWLSRNPMVMFGKFYFLNQAMQLHPEYDSVFWIDAGLFHGGLFPNMLKGSGSIGDFDYPLISQDLGNKLATATNDKLFFVRSTTLNHGYIEYEEVFSDRPTYGVVAGIFGGDSTKLRSFVDKCLVDVQYCISKFALLKEEEIIYRQHKLMSSEQPDALITFTFDSWYHPDWTEIFNSATMTGFYEWSLFLTDPNYKIKHDYTF